MKCKRINIHSSKAPGLTIYEMSCAVNVLPKQIIIDNTHFNATPCFEKMILSTHFSIVGFTGI